MTEISFGWELATAPKDWRPIEQKHLVVYDATSFNILELGWSRKDVGVVHVRSEVVHVAPKVLVLTLVHLFRFRRLNLAYRAAVLQSLKPNVVVTTIDNDYFFHKLASAFPDSRFIALQNGMRTWSETFGSCSGYHFNTHLLCFGQKDIDSLSRLGVHFKSLRAIGSTKFALWETIFFDKPEPLHEVPPTYDLCVVSQFRYTQDESEHSFRSRLVTFTEDIAAFVMENRDLRVCVALTYSDQDPSDLNSLSAEQQFYRDYLGDIPDLIPNNSSGTGAYELTSASGVNTSFGSTASFEAAAAGRRTVVHQPDGNRGEMLELRAPWLLAAESRETFHQTLRHVMAMTDLEFYSEYARSIHYFMEKSGRDTLDEFSAALVPE